MLGLESIDLGSKQNAKAIGIPLFVVVILAIVILGVGNMAYSRFTTQYSDLEQARTEEEELQVKLSLLSEVETESLDASNRSLVALPEKNPGLFMLSQVKALADKYQLTIVESRVDSDNAYKGDLTRAQVKVSVEDGDVVAYTNFLKELPTLAPLSSLESVTIERSTNGDTLMEAGLYVYWSPLPTTLPALTEPLKALSPSDEAILAELSNLKVPSFTVLNPTDPTDRENPFE